MPPPSSVPKRRVKGKPIAESDTDSSWAKLSFQDAMDSDVDTVKSMEVVKSDAGGSASDASETMSSVASGPSRRVGSEASVASDPAESESTRQEHFSKLRVVIYNLQEVDKKLAAFNGGSKVAATQAGEEPDGGVDADEPDWTNDGSKEIADLEKQLGQPMTKEEASRLTNLLAEQTQMLEGVLSSLQADERKKTEDSAGDQALDAIVRGDADGCLEFVEKARPDQIEAVADPAGMTLLHWACRQHAVKLVFAILGKCPTLCDRPTKAGRNPPNWTPLMVLADQPVATQSRQGPDWQEDISKCRQIAAALVNHMTQTGLMTRGGTYSTVLHLAASRANTQLIKKVLFRMNDLGGKPAVHALLEVENATVSCLP